MLPVLFLICKKCVPACHTQKDFKKGPSTLCCDHPEFQSGGDYLLKIKYQMNTVGHDVLEIINSLPKLQIPSLPSFNNTCIILESQNSKPFKW